MNKKALVLLALTAIGGECFASRPPAAVPGEGFIGRSMEVLHNADSIPLGAAILSNDFRPVDQDVPNLGLGNAAHWVRFDMARGEVQEPLVLHLMQADIDRIEVYAVDKAGKVSRIGLSGLEVQGSQRQQRDDEFSFNIPSDADGPTIYMKARSSKQLQFPVKLKSASAYVKGKAVRNLILGGYTGIMLVMALYNFFIYLSTRSRNYLLYVFYIISVALTQFAFSGTGPFQFWPELPWFATRATVLLTIATAILAAEFLIHFIDTRLNCPRLHMGIRWAYPFFGAAVLLDVIGMQLLAYQVTQLISGVFATYLITVVVRVLLKGSRQAAYFLLAWSGFLVGTMLFVMKDLGLLPYNDLTVYAMPVGSAIEGVLLSFALADRINVLRREKEQSQAQSLAISRENERIIREQNVILETKVKERTHALEESNEHLKRTQTQLVNAEKMASLGQLTAGIAHEINNPINFITSNIQPLRRNIGEIIKVMQGYRGLGTEDTATRLRELKELEERIGIAESIEELDGIIDSIAEGSSRTAEIVRGLRNFSRLDEDDLKDTDLNEGLRSTLTVLAPQFRDKVEVRMDLGALPPVECYPGKVNQVFMNIITNAMQAVLGDPGKEQRTVSISSSTSLNGMVSITIADNGVGMTEEVKARIYDPFFTTKPVGEGTGLGMAIVYGIVEDHHGRITVETEVGRGSSFTLELPVRQPRINEQRA